MTKSAVYTPVHEHLRRLKTMYKFIKGIYEIASKYLFSGAGRLRPQ